MKPWLPLAVLAFSLAACTQAPPDPAFDEAAGNRLLLDYDSAREDGDWELAEYHADELRRKHGETRAAATMRQTLADVQAKAEVEREQRRLRDAWDYQRNPVEGGGVQVTAALDSRVGHDPESETPPPIPDARLIFRRHPSWGDSAYLVLAQKELKCGPPCRLRIRFDGGEPQTYAGDPADTGTGPALFIVDRDRFLEALDAAGRVRIELPASGHLTPSFEFEVGGFDKQRHLRD
ncbi:hypothetical protein [Arenimonas composti]|uniref:Lipoprotein n=1 Tax=Arenimonas composti TR7-09 = DSM 18010 TaxID=1121013 RepID=A0A091BA49_9GAMM|nr:hypothetical protein [Arenimonas composti]KFN48606.1 hypothetical protein P873_13995 [Arenimonas composti TR7-09 = DSM 18010]